MNPDRVLIVNADDFGLSSGVNRGIVEAHERGIVTSTSLMVRGRATKEAASRSRTLPELSVGLHVDLGEWVFRNGDWKPLYQVVALDFPARVSEEIERQLGAFESLLGRKPTHLDSHQHVHQREPVRSALKRTAEALGVPLRHETTSVRYCGDFYGQTGEGDPLPDAISVASLLKLVEDLPAGITELCCHPGYMDSSSNADYPTMYARERAVEVSGLCDPRVKAAIVSCGIDLRSFAEICLNGETRR